MEYQGFVILWMTHEFGTYWIEGALDALSALTVNPTYDILNKNMLEDGIGMYKMLHI